MEGLLPNPIPSLIERERERHSVCNRYSLGVSSVCLDIDGYRCVMAGFPLPCLFP